MFCCASLAVHSLSRFQLENSILELLVDNLTRLNESEESDRQGVFHILGAYECSQNRGFRLTIGLGIFENILGFDPKLATPLVQNTKILSWLLTRIKAKTHDDNRGYAAELLSILMQNNQENRLALCKEDGIEVCLTVVSVGETSCELYQDPRLTSSRCLVIQETRSSRC